MRVWIGAWALCAVSCFSTGAALAAEPETPDGVEEIEVSGERPGPNLWKVSNGDHFVWIMGTLDPLPKGITWRPNEIEAVLGEVKQLVPSRPDLDVSAGPITLVRTYMAWRRAKKIPGNETLKDWLPPALYARWTALRIRYKAKDNDIEKLVPVLAASKLYARALDISKLSSSGDGIEKSVIKLARKHNVKVRQTEIKIEDPRALVNQFGEMPRERQVACLESIVERLEKDMETMKAQANAWALGDVATLRGLPYPKEIEVCKDMFETSEVMRKIIEGTNSGWNGSVDAALNGTGKPTLAVKPIYELLGANGTIEKLRARGFKVEGP
ncbi:MAG: TraB/GumN family protein [Gammaproteobacteria bacterium]